MRVFFEVVGRATGVDLMGVRVVIIGIELRMVDGMRWMSVGLIVAG